MGSEMCIRDRFGGAGNATRIIQRAISKAGFAINVDGIMGPATGELSAHIQVVDVFKERQRFISRIVQNDPSQATFLPGWNERAMEFV